MKANVNGARTAFVRGHSSFSAKAIIREARILAVTGMGKPLFYLRRTSCNSARPPSLHGLADHTCTLERRLPQFLCGTRTTIDEPQTESNGSVSTIRPGACLIVFVRRTPHIWRT